MVVLSADQASIELPTPNSTKKTDETNTTETETGLEIYLDSAKAGQHKLLLGYVETGADWNPSYNLWISDSQRGSAKLNAIAEVRNNADEDWNNTVLKLAVGSPYFVEGSGYQGYYRDYNAYAKSAGQAMDAAPSAAPVFNGQDVGTQYIYTLSDPVTILKGESANLKLFDSSAQYERYNLWENGGDVQQVVHIANSAGKPFAAGVVRVYENGVLAGEANGEYVGEGAGAEVKFAALPQIKVKKELNQTSDKPSSDRIVTTYSVSMNIASSAKESKPLTLRDYMSWGDSVALVSSSVPADRLSNNQLEWKVDAPSGANLTISYVYKVTNFQQRPIYG